MKNGKVFKPLPPLPRDAGFHNKHDFLFIKEVVTTNGSLYLRGEQCHTRFLALSYKYAYLDISWFINITKSDPVPFNLFENYILHLKFWKFCKVSML